MSDWFFPYLKKYGRRLCLSAVLSVLALVCAAGLLFTSGYLISKAALRPENILLIYVPIVGVRTFGIFRAALQYAARLTSHDAILRILSEMRSQLYARLEPAALFIRSRFRTGDILGVLSDDIEHLQDVYLRTAIPGASAVVIYGLWIALIGWMDSLFALFMGLYLIILLIVFPLLSLLRTEKSRKLFSENRHLMFEKLTDAVLGSADWMMSGRQSSFLSSYDQFERRTALIENRLHVIRRWRDFFSQLIIGGSVIALLYWAGSMSADGHMSRTLIAAFVLTVFTISESLIPVSEAVERIPQYKEAFTRLSQIKSAIPGESEKKVGEKWTRTADRLDIHIEDLSFKYNDDDDWAVRDVAFNVAQGERVALIGRSGAGKTTLIHLIYGALKPVRGKVLINGAPADFIGSDLSHQISVLNQNPHLFDTSVLNNIALGNEHSTKEEIVRAAKLVRLNELIEALPEGYDTQMHEAGDIFSGGERERLALARILLRNSPVVILDEPTVGLDPATEKNLLQTIFKTLEGKTLIWITHHLVGAEKMDQIIFMEEGTVRMKGTHEQLFRENARYRRLYQLDVPEHLKQAIKKY
ncbi:thiol reductant ABC exporter subunit CydC [Sporolactobacillus shoreae]|uniref:Thiol reductant ABC exporter subunit CydC n=1 Tax=Sporolactobacillus shoreae TaxID=1465501 RepID=A0A4Z0GU22_9BACL|nr:thiol reductant ABC exporter subunit CydC [Sporolactobacillus shoreae]TGB00117.1 thiol reductant ABC exporter subunit CydC [Sporolactobacillus shoreae]